MIESRILDRKEDWQGDCGGCEVSRVGVLWHTCNHKETPSEGEVMSEWPRFTPTSLPAHGKDLSAEFTEKLRRLVLRK